MKTKNEGKPQTLTPLVLLLLSISIAYPEKSRRPIDPYAITATTLLRKMSLFLKGKGYFIGRFMELCAEIVYVCTSPEIAFT